MNDTHGEKGKGWYGFDLDGTLAKYDGWKGIDHIGDPIAPMVKLIRQMHDEGKVVKIMTARAAPKEKPETKPNPYRTGNWCVEAPDVQTWALKNEWTPLEFIQEWCYRHLGFVPEIVYQKDHLMLELYDDRVKQVVPNEGWLVEDIAKSKREVHVIQALDKIDIRWSGMILCFLFGMLVACLIGLAIHTFAAATTTVPEAEQRLHNAIHEYMQSKVHERTEGLLK